MRGARRAHAAHQNEGTGGRVEDFGSRQDNTAGILVFNLPNLPVAGGVTPAIVTNGTYPGRA